MFQQHDGRDSLYSFALSAYLSEYVLLFVPMLLFSVSIEWHWQLYLVV